MGCIVSQPEHLLLKQGISVFYLKTQFLQEVIDAGLSPNNSKIYDIEDLNDVTHPGVIRRKGLDVTCPIDDQLGASYVHCLEDDDHVGEAHFMLSYR